MDVVQRLIRMENKPITCLEMHTCGEPTRIVIGGYPSLTGTLLEQRAQAQNQHDHIRRRLMLEPRGHYDMYGAILRPKTELTQSGQAHMGVLFMTNDGYSTMCGHATIALGRFLVDTHQPNIFPRRNDVTWDQESLIAHVNIHAPCGLLRLKVPVNCEGTASDPTRRVSFISVPSFVTGLQIPVSIRAHKPQREGQDGASERVQIPVDFAYGGAFYAFVAVAKLGFEEHLQDVDKGKLGQVAGRFLSDLHAQTELEQYFKHPEEPEMSFLYGVIVTDNVWQDDKPVANEEMGVCFFADRQTDRSPTGSGVAARAALAHSKKERKMGISCTYHSPVSICGLGVPFVGTVEEGVADQAAMKEVRAVRVRVEGQAFYTGSNIFCVEPEDPLGDSGFVFNQLSISG